MLRKLLILSMAMAMVWTTIGCGGGDSSLGGPTGNQPRSERSAQSVAQTRIADGQYPVQQATYNDADGEYTLMLLNTPAGGSPTYRAQNIPMARLTDDEVKAGKKSYLKVENGEPALYLTEDFKIEYVHNVTETRTDPQTGQPQTVVVRQESNFWTPFLGAFAGQALASYLFRPQYYVPPVYQPGVPLSGWGGYGSSYNQAVSSYRSRYNAPPAEVRNRQTFRTTGRLRSPAYGQPSTQSPQRYSGSNRSTGSGYGSSTLRRSNGTSPRYSTPRSGFGSGTRSRAGARRR